MGSLESHCLVVCAAPLGAGVLPRCGSLDNSLIIAADGGYLRCDELGITPSLVLGDFDSAPMPPSTPATFVFPAKKDDTDCLLAVKEGLARGCRTFTLLGCTGGRLDHTLSAIQVLVYLTVAGASGRILDAEHMLTVLTGGQSLTLTRGGHYFSLFSLGDRCTGVTLVGAAYPLTNATLENSFPLGTSNQIVAETVHITVSAGTLLVVEVF